MKRNYFFCVIFLLASNLLSANTPPVLVFSPGFISNDKDTCDLPAPSNFQVEDIGSTWVKLTWMPSSPTIQHRVKTYRVIGNVLVSNIVVPAGQMFVTVTGLSPGLTYYSVANAICPDGTDSKYKVQTAEFDTIITDLIVNGFEDSGSSATCGVSAVDQYCEFSLSGSNAYFKICPTGSSLGTQFLATKLFSPEVRLRVTVLPNSEDYQFAVNGTPPNEDEAVRGSPFQIYYQSTLIATFVLYEHRNSNSTSIGRLLCTYINSSYEIVRLGPAFATPPTEQLIYNNVNESNDYIRNLGHLVSVSPNPFFENIAVNLTYPAAQEPRIQLFNLNGQMVLEQHFEAGQDQYIISTAALSPGFYLMRMEVDGEVHTLKVVKAD